MIHVLRQSLAELKVDAVMRPVRSDFAPVSAVGRELGARAGERVEESLGRLGSLPIGGAAMTPAGDLQAGFLIHVVVMSEEEPQTSGSVRKAVGNGLRRAADMGVESLALPPIGIGVGLTEPETEARVLVGILQEHLDGGVEPLDLKIVVSSDFEADLFKGLIAERARDRETP